MALKHFNNPVKISQCCLCFSFSGLQYFLSFRRLFPDQEELADELLHRIDLKPTLRPHQLTLEQFHSITNEFVRMCHENELSTSPLAVNKPDRIVR